MSLLNGAWFDFVVGNYKDDSPTDLLAAGMERAFSPRGICGSEYLGRLPQAGMGRAVGAADPSSQSQTIRTLRHMVIKHLSNAKSNTSEKTI